MSDDEGASPLEQLMYAAKTDSEEMATIALESDKLGDVNALDGLGMTGKEDHSVHQHESARADMGSLSQHCTMRERSGRYQCHAV